MDQNWWKQAKGTKVADSADFQKHMSDMADKFIVVDFFMPQCHYCVEFMPQWNEVVDYFKTEYGDQVEFLKVDGDSDYITAARYKIHSYPSFIII